MNRIRWIVLASLLLFAFATRVCHLGIVWVEEAYPAAAAIQMSSHGKEIYKDFWFDKPPGAAYFYRLFDAQAGWPLRIAGALFVFSCALLAYLTARRLWGGETEALIAACLLVFALTFDHPAAVMAIAPDLLMVLPQLAALYLVASQRYALAGVACGVAFWINPKAVFVAAGCLVWSRSPLFAASATASALLFIAPFWSGWWEQVIVWGRMYSADPPGANPWWEGVRQTGSWLAFHATLAVAAGFAIARDGKRRWTWLAMLGLGFAAVTLGLRFYPRYFFQLLPLLVILAARGLWLAPVRARWALCALLLIPLVRFGRQYPILAADLLQNRPHAWNQLALADDSREAVRLLQLHAKSTDTLFVWGYRPDILMLSRMALGDPFLDSQPVNGVFADRHLIDSKPSLTVPAYPGFRSTFIIDGLGLLNPNLPFVPGQDYAEVARTKFSILYRRRIQ